MEEEKHDMTVSELRRKLWELEVRGFANWRVITENHLSVRNVQPQRIVNHNSGQVVFEHVILET